MVAVLAMLGGTVVAAPSPVAPVSVVKGIDISKFQGDLIGHLGDRPDIRFILCKATEGLDYVDPDFRKNWRAIESQGKVRGAYHFFHVQDDPILQADAYIKALNSWWLLWHRGLKSKDLPPVVDIERASLKGPVDIAELHKRLLAFLNRIEAKTGRRPILYTNGYFADIYLVNPAFAKYPLWLADYTNQDQPTVPKTWQTVGYRLWQKSESYTLDSQAVDFDVFNGTEAEFKKGF